MRRLDRYLLRELMVPLGACLGGFLIFWVAFDLLGELEDFQKRRLGAGDVLLYYWYGLPELLATVLPVGLLLALLYALTQHARHNEVTAIRAAGVGFVRLCAPYFLVGLLFAVGLFAVNEYWAGPARDRQELVLNRRLDPEASVNQLWAGNVNFQNLTDRHSWSLGAFHLPSGGLRSPRIRLPVEPGSSRGYRAERVLWTNGAWRAVGPIEWFRLLLEPGVEVSRGVSSAEFPGIEADPDAVARWSGRDWMVPRTVIVTNRWVITNAPPGTNVVVFTNEVTTVQDTWRTNLTAEGPAPGVRWRAASWNPVARELAGVEVTLPVEPDAQRLVMAETGGWTNGKWVLGNARDFLYRNARDGDPLRRESEALPVPQLNESPAMLRSEVRISGLHRGRALRRPQLTLDEIRDYYHLHPRVSPELRAWLDTQRHARLAAPWTCLVVVLIAVPFGAGGVGGRRNVFYGVAGSILIAFAYFVLQRFGFALGQSGGVPPFLGAWLPNLVFALTGGVLISRMR